MISFLDSSSIIVVGGYGGTGNGNLLTSVEVIGDNKCSIPQLPFGISRQPSIILTKDDQILACGGTGKD